MKPKAIILLVLLAIAIGFVMSTYMEASESATFEMAEANPENASFVVGKYLSPKLYVSYGLGLFDPITTLRVKYDISRHWKLVSESSSEASGGDVIYTIESGE